MQVRDAAAVAYAKAVLAFPEECRAAVSEIWPLWLSLLDDNVYSVRQHAAMALGDVARAYESEVIDALLPLIRWVEASLKSAPLQLQAVASIAGLIAYLARQGLLLCRGFCSSMISHTNACMLDRGFSGVACEHMYETTKRLDAILLLIIVPAAAAFRFPFENAGRGCCKPGTSLLIPPKVLLTQTAGPMRTTAKGMQAKIPSPIQRDLMQTAKARKALWQLLLISH